MEYNLIMKKYITTTEAGEILGLDRTQVFRLIKSGKIPADKIGGNYLILIDSLGVDTGKLTEKQKEMIEKSVKQVFKQYGEVIKKLGEE